MKKCKGCGVILQNEDVKAKGYVKNLDQDYCMRCFRLEHYGDLIIDMKKAIDRTEVIKALNETKETIVFVVDIMAIESAFKEDVLECFKGRDVILIINKYDLLPKNINIEKIEKYLNNITLSLFKGINVKDIIITHYKDQYFNEIFYETLSNLNLNKVIFAGNANAGKSTIINKLIEGKNLTTSIYPSTTLDFNSIKFNEYEFIDSPGFVDEGNALLYIAQDEIKDVLINKTIKPKIFQLYENQAYVVDALFNLELEPKNNKASVIFYINNALEIHRTKTSNKQNYIEKHYDEFKYKSEATSLHFYNIEDDNVELVINGVGIISLKNIKYVNLELNENIEVILRKMVF